MRASLLLREKDCMQIRNQEGPQSARNVTTPWKDILRVHVMLPLHHPVKHTTAELVGVCENCLQRPLTKFSCYIFKWNIIELLPFWTSARTFESMKAPLQLRGKKSANIYLFWSKENGKGAYEENPAKPYSQIACDVEIMWFSTEHLNCEQQSEQLIVLSLVGS